MTLVRVKHAQFQYFVEAGPPKTHKRTGDEVPNLGRRFASRGQIVDVPRDEDYDSGIASGAIEDVPASAESDEASDEEAAEEELTGEEVDIDSHDDLVIWIRDDKPTATAVIKAAGDDPDRARKLMDAENEASGSQPRKTVMDALRKIAEDA